jgi:predicted DNA binding CopG/RHH family protein
MKTIPIQYSDEEHAEVKERAKKAGLPLYKYIKRKSLGINKKPK